MFRHAKTRISLAVKEQEHAIARHDGAESDQGIAGGRTTGWSLKESFFQARHEDDQRKSIVQQVLQKSMGFLRRIIAPVEGQGEVTLSYVCPHGHRYPLEDYNWWVSMGHGDSAKKENIQCCCQVRGMRRPVQPE